MSRAVTLAEVVACAKTLPSAPWLLPKLMEQLADLDSAADQVEALIKVDAGLASGTLRLANSAYFRHGMKCESLSDAILRLGFREIYRLATTKLVAGWLNHKVDGYGWEPGDLYRHSLTAAVGADLLAKQTGRVTPEVAYTAGLLHDVGKLALAFACAEHFDKVRQLQANEQDSWRQAEQKIFGYDHTDVAAELVKEWGFPPSLIQVVRFYPRPAEAAADHRSLVAHVHAAKHMALCLGTGVGEEGFHSELDEPLLAEEGISAEIIESLLPAVLDISTKLLRTD